MSEAPLTLEQVTSVVERRGGDIPRVPLFWHKFYNAQTVEKYGRALESLNGQIVDDVVDLHFVAPWNFHNPDGTPENYQWAIENRTGPKEEGPGAIVGSPDLIGRFIDTMPDPSPVDYYQGARATADANPGRYCMGWDPYFLFERAWFLFGMEEILCELVSRTPRVKRLLRALTEYHKKVMTGLAQAGAHGYLTTDDLGTQSAVMFSPDLFREMLLPLYRELIDHCHRCGMHFWLHSCGRVTALLDDFVAAGLDVLHPVQPGAMDQQAVSEQYRGRLTFLAGLDVQHLLPFGTAQQVADGTRRLIDAFDHPEGGCIIAAANAIMPETPLENIRAFLHTAQTCGRRRGGGS